MSDQRTNYINDPLARLEQSDHNKIIPDWLFKEASYVEESWEKDVKKKLELENQARHFQQKFLEATTVENRQTVPLWDASKAADWIEKQCMDKDGKFDRTRAIQIMDEAGALDEKKVDVLQLLSAEHAPKPGKPEEGSPTKNFSEEKTPSRIYEVDLQKEEKYAKELKKRKSVGSYGVILTNDSAQVYKEGELLSEMKAEDIGGIGILASEVDALSTESDVEMLFNLASQGPVNSGWFKSADMDKCCDKYAGKQFCAECGTNLGEKKEADGLASEVYQNPTEQYNDLQKSDSGVFDPNAVDQSSTLLRDFAQDPGALSVNPGANTPVAPGIPDNDKPFGK